MALQLIAMNGPFVLRTQAVNRLRDHLFSGAAFAENQDRRRGWRHLADERKHGLHRRAAAQHAFEHVRALSLLHGAVFLFELGHVDASLQHDLELVHLHGLDRGNRRRRPRRRGARSAFSPWPETMTTFASGSDRQQRRQRRETFLGVVRPRRQAEIEQGHEWPAGRKRSRPLPLDRRPSPPRNRMRAPISSAFEYPHRPRRSGCAGFVIARATGKLA